MENYVSFNVKERFPVGNKGVALLQYPTEPPHFEICLYDRDNPLMFYGQIRETSERGALNIYLKRCDTLVEQYEQKTEQQFPLPSTAMAVLTSTGDLVIIRRGMTGYYPSDWNVPGDRKRNEATASYHNAQHELTKVQCAAMVCGSMRDVMDYAMNDAKTEKQFYVSGWNVLPFTAREEMQITKHQFGKEDGILAFHGYQSFKPGEVTPEIAHEIGLKLAEELWPDHQVIVATHLDKDHIHSHFVVNSVSLNGRKFNATKESYRQMRAASDRLCKEYGLSVIEDSLP